MLVLITYDVKTEKALAEGVCVVLPGLVRILANECSIQCLNANLIRRNGSLYVLVFCPNIMRPRIVCAFTSSEQIGSAG